MATRLLVVLASTPVALIGCHSTDDGLPTRPPTSVTNVSSGGFESPTDAVASSNGRTFYFAAWSTPDKQATLYQVSSEPGSVPKVLASGDPLEAPFGLVLSCDDSTLYAADLGGADMGDNVGGIFAVPTAGGQLAALGATGLTRPGGLAMGPDCKSLFATGRLPDGTAAVFQVPTGGGTARVVYQGLPLMSPAGLHVDNQGVLWVMDPIAPGAQGEGVLFAIQPDGSKATEVVSSLRMGTPGGVSLTAGGGTAVMPTRDENGAAQLTVVDIATHAVTQLPTPNLAVPAGLRTARKAGVFALVDQAGQILSAE